MILFYLYLFFLYSSNLCSNSDSFCGTNLLSSEVQKQLINNVTLKANNNRINDNKRKLSEYTPIKIIIDNQYLSDQLTRKIVSENKYTLILNALNTATSMLSSLISVEKYNNPITLDKDIIIKNCHLEENSYKATYLSPNKIPGDSIIIYPRFHDFNQKGNNNILSSAKFCYLDNDIKRPLAGFIYIEKNITELEMRKTNIDKYYTMIFLHELTHILIFDAQLFSPYNPNIEIKKIEILKQRRTIISSPKVIEMAKRHFGCKTLKGIELENQDYDWKEIINDDNQNPYDEYSNHWDARTMLTDYMTSIHYDEITISEITLALFEDSGWYKVKYYTGGLFRYGKNQGCEFLNSYCVYGDISLHKNEYCITERATMCTPGRTHRAMCGLTTYPDELDKYYRYFTDSRKGGYLPQTDYCPVAKTNSSISKTYFYQGHCSYGEIELFPENLGYTMGENSICLLSSLTPKNNETLKEYPSSFRALCYKVDCYSKNEEKAVRIFIGNNAVICPISGGIQTLDGYNGFILCPDYNLICTGTKWCLDPISCVNKRSEPKTESYIYNYKASTSQEYQELLNYKVPVKDEIPLYYRYIFYNKIFILFMFFCF